MVVPSESLSADAPAAVSQSSSDVQLANALAAAAAAVSAEAEVTSSAIGDETTHRVVTRVLERMLPSIMTELAKEMEAARNKK